MKKGEQETVVSHKVAKCHGYDGYIRVKILAGLGKSLVSHKKSYITSLKNYRHR